MNKRQIDKAARLYALAVVANYDAGGAETEDETDVVMAAVDHSRARLEALGYSWFELSSLDACMKAAMQAKP